MNIGHDEELEKAIFDKYHEIRKDPETPCDECGKRRKILNERRPVSFFVVGENFLKERNRVVFVGKTVQSGWNEKEDGLDPSGAGFIDARKAGKELFFPFWSTYPFWQCTKEVCQKVWGINDVEELWKKVMITNIVKCSVSDGLDKTPPLLMKNCIKKAKFFEEEIKLVKPTHIIYFTGRNYDDYIEELNFGYDAENEPAKDFKNFQSKSETRMLRWHIKFLKNGQVVMHALRTYHPAYFKNKDDQEEFTSEIANWIKGTPILV